MSFTVEKSGSLGTGTPCVRSCKLNPYTQVCEGCYRTLEEIASWLSYPEERRAEIIKLLDKRKNELT